MFKKKKSFALIAGMSAMAVLAACGNGDEGSAEEPEGTENGGRHFEEITIMAPTFETTAPPDGNDWQQEVEDVAGVEFNIDWVPQANYDDRLNVTLASTDIPQVMVIPGKTPGFLNSAEAGAFWELSEYLDDFEYLSNYDPDVLNNSSVNGEVYGIYRGRDLMRQTAIIRRDWLENLGLDTPETIDDLYEVLYAFTHNDPNQSGADDTVGLIESDAYSAIDTLPIWFGAPNQWGIEDGEFVPAFDTPEYKEALDWFKNIVDEGLINPDWTTLSHDDWENQLFNGTGGVIIATYSNAMRVNNLLADQEGVSRDDAYFIEITGTLRSPIDDQEYGYPTEGYAGFLAISKTAVQTEEELLELLGYLNNMSSPEGMNALNHGIEGRTYEVDDDGYFIGLETDEALELRAYEMGQISTYGDGLLEPVVVNPMQQRRYQLMEENEEFAVHNAAAPYVSETYTRQGQQLDEIIADARIRYVAGQITEDDWYAEVQRWYDSGGQQVIEEFTELYQEAN